MSVDVTELLIFGIFTALSVHRNVDGSSANIREELTKNDVLSKNETSLFRRPHVLVTVGIILLCLTGLVVGMVILLTKDWSRDDPFDDLSTISVIFTTHSTTVEVPSSTSHGTTPSETTLPPGTTQSPETTQLPETTPFISSTADPATTLPEPPYKIFTRADWDAAAVKGDKKLKSPVDRIIVMDTQTDTCSGEEDCKTFVRLRQREGNLYEDIFENFLIAPDGSVFEGRGFEFEGQHSFDRVLTSYNNQAIGVSFIGNYTETHLSEDQFEGFKYFVQRSVNESLIRVDYKLYFREQLVGPNVITKRLQAAVTTWDHWTEGDIAT